MANISIKIKLLLNTLIAIQVAIIVIVDIANLALPRIWQILPVNIERFGTFWAYRGRIFLFLPLYFLIFNCKNYL
jgi:hypothetical protein